MENLLTCNMQLSIFPPMKRFPLLPLVFFVVLVGSLPGCGGGSGRSGDDGASSLSGCAATLVEEGTARYSLQFTGQEVEIVQRKDRIAYRGTYTYVVRDGSNAALLNIQPVVEGNAYCSMDHVQIVFEDAGRQEGVITAGTCTEAGPRLDPAVHEKPQPMDGWRFVLYRD